MNPLSAENGIDIGRFFEAALKRFNRKIQQDGVLAESRRRWHYEKPAQCQTQAEGRSQEAQSPEAQVLATSGG